MRYLPLLFFVCACATPQTVLKNNTDKYVTCGGSSVGSVAGGMIGYSIQQDNDKKCIDDFKKQGFVIVKHSDE